MANLPKKYAVIGIDPGINICSLTHIKVRTGNNQYNSKRRIKVIGTDIFKPNREPKTQFERIVSRATEIYNAVAARTQLATVALETPIFRPFKQGSNAKVFGDQMQLHALLMYLFYNFGFRVIPIHPKEVKVEALGRGNSTKKEMLAEYIKRFGKYPSMLDNFSRTTVASRETLADSFFIAMAGLRRLFIMRRKYEFWPRNPLWKPDYRPKDKVIDESLKHKIDMLRKEGKL